MQQLFLSIVLVISSAAGLVVEIVAGRLLAPYVGMSLYTWTAIIAVVLAGLSAGHWVGGVLAGPGTDTRIGARRLAYALAAASVSSLLSLVLLRVLAGVLMQPETTHALGPIVVIISLTTGAFFLPSLFVGIVSPILTKLAMDMDPQRPGRVLGRMYALGTLGSIAGTLSAGYLFISWIGSTGTILMVAGVYAVLALLFALADPLRLILVLVLGVFGGGTVLWGNQVAAFASPCQVESDYFCIRIDDFSNQSGRPSALMALDHLVHSINDLDDPGLLYSPYIHFIDEATRMRYPAPVNAQGLQAFFIGGGGFTLPRAWAHRMPHSQLMVAEIDPAVTRAAADHLGLKPEMTALDIHHQDARVLLQSLPAVPQFDIIFGDAFHDISIPAHLVSREFHQEITQRLKSGGFYALNVVDQGANPRFLMSLVHTLRSDFAHVEVWLQEDETATPGRVTFLVLASGQPSKSDVMASSYGIDRRWVRWPHDQLSKSIAQAGSPILTDDYAPVDRLMSGLLLGDGF